jgi:hypothetical protein
LVIATLRMDALPSSTAGPSSAFATGFIPKTYRLDLGFK